MILGHRYLGLPQTTICIIYSFYFSNIDKMSKYKFLKSTQLMIIIVTIGKLESEVLIMELEIFSDQLKNIGKRVEQLKPSIGTEEATKTSLIMPFFQTLGFDIFNPIEFVPEFTADVGIKKGEKVDYAIVLNGLPVILIEAKSINENLSNHDSQLFRYFGTTNAKFGILTNGEEYRFYTDLEVQNKMDSEPFLTLNITDIKSNQFSELSKFHKENFDIDKITSSASELKYLGSLKDFLGKQFDNPGEEFVRYLVGEIYEGQKTKATIEKFNPIIKKGVNQFITERVNEKISAALNTSVASSETDTIVDAESSVINEEVITTSEELESFTIVKLILKETIDISRIYYRDNKSYFNILLDDNIRKWIIRVYMGGKQSRIVLNDAAKTVYEIDTPISISDYSDEIVNIVSSFL